MAWLTTTVLLERLRDADQTVWGDFVDRFREPILSFARRLGLTPDEAEDVAQESLAAFLEAYRAGDYDREKGRLHSWLFGIAHRRALNVARRRPPERQAPATAFFAAVPDPVASRATWDASWKRAMLAHCLDQLRGEVEPHTLDAFDQFAIRNRPAADVARDLGLSCNAVFLAKRRVLARLRELTDSYEQE